MNSLVEKKLVAENEESRKFFCRWISNDAFRSIENICEADVFNDTRSLSALSEVLNAVSSSLDSIDDDDLEEEIDYIFDAPSRIEEWVEESPNIPRFISHSYEFPEEEMLERLTMRMSPSNRSVHYKIRKRE